ncbi:P-loop containing nucleoside triphosphate hydrolase protein [Phaeosphaeria sp. MPI-PUGE-AT-0046c]|nr:P-loop containing nucleoside triphosphate hydrolase protein [Phaeosphaeria sp. MPI-PUGE-AT-0046c]
MSTLSPDDIFIAVMGMTGAGKTRFVTNCTGQPAVETQSLESCTMGLTMHTLSVPGLDKRVCLIDTPGFDDTNRSDADILQEVAFWLIKSYELGVRLSGVIYLHRITDVRLGGSAVQGLNVFKAMCGADNFHGVTMATTFWDKVDDFDKAREDNKELLNNSSFWKDLADGNCTTRSLTAGRTSALELVTAIAHSNKRLVLNMQRQLVDEGLRIYETDAGKVLQESWFQEKSDLHSKLVDTRKQLTAALAANETNQQQELQLYYNDLSTKITQRNAALKQLSQPTEVITDAWSEKAFESLELTELHYDDVTDRLEQAMASLDQQDMDSTEYMEQEEVVDELAKEQEVADRLKSIQIASYSIKLNKAALGTAVVSAVAGIASAGAAVAPLVPLLLACNVM